MERVDLLDIRKGDALVEENMGMTMQMVAIEDGRSTKEGIECLAKNEYGNEVRLFYAHGYEHYGPKVYRVKYGPNDDKEKE